MKPDMKSDLKPVMKPVMKPVLRPGRPLIFICLTLVLLLLLCGCSHFEESVFRLELSAARNMAHMAQKSVLVEGKTVSYIERSGPGETMVFVHGFGANKENWLGFVRHIPESFRVIALDLPGHGESALDFEGPFDVESMERRLSEALDCMGVKRFHIAGNSMGGLVSLLYVNNHPERVISLGLFDSAGIVTPVKNDFFKALDQGKNPLIVSTRQGYDSLLKFCFETEPFLPWPARNVMARQHIARSEHYLGMWNTLFSDMDDTPVRQAVSGLKLPVLVVWGDRDRILDISCARVFVSLIPNGTLAIIENCGHVPMVEKPGETARNYMAFVNAIKHR